MFFFISLFFLLNNKIICQTTIVFNHQLNNKKIIIDSTVNVDTVNGFKTETLKYYISAIQFLQNNKLVYTEPSSFHLIDLKKPASLSVIIPTKKKLLFNHLKFSIGIDSLTNVSGAMGGDLDPTNGMYWTWQSGYINFKLEGETQHLDTIKNNIQYHIGGYQSPYNALQIVNLPVKSAENISVLFNLNALVNYLKNNSVKQIMSPSSESVECAKIFSTCFSSK